MELTIEKIQEIANNQLTERELSVMRLDAGAEIVRAATIGKALGITRQRVEQLRASATRKLEWQGIK